MFSQVEIDYILSLINTYQRQGYKYYLCNTITDNNILYDIDIYFSKKAIKAVSSTTFDLTEAIHIKIDSSTSYNQLIYSRDVLVNSKLTDVVTINDNEFIYTNAVVSSSESTLINPDLLLNASYNYDNILLMGASVLLSGMIFLYIFFTHILRLKK